jgi:colicin import membrane protein
MLEFIQKHWTSLLGALLLHVLFAGVFGLTLISMARRAPPPQLAIQAVLVDSSLLTRSSREQERERERAEQRERERVAEQRRREREEQAQRETAERQEQERRVELKQREEAEQRRVAEERQLRERQEAERKRAAEQERQQRLDAERKRAEEIKRKQEEVAQQRRAEAEARAQAARETELQRQLAEEEGRTQAVQSGLLNQYTALIEQRIVRNWNRPPSARPGLECEVRVTQAPGGTVLSVQLGACNGDAAVRQSIENAVMRSSPLPPPPDPRLFDRNLVLRFKPLE